MDVIKTSFAQHFAGIKCRFYLSDHFLYAIQTQYEKYRNVLIFETQDQIFGQSFTILKTVYRRCPIIDFWRLLCQGKYLNLFIQLEKQVSYYKEKHFVELEILRLLI